MEVTLPMDSEYSGEEILNAFKSAVTIEEPLKEKWFVSDFEGEVKYKPGSMIVVVHQGAMATCYKWGKKWGFFGKYCWLRPTDNDARAIRILPLDKEERYYSVEIEVGRITPYTSTFVAECGHRDFYPNLTGIIENFVRELQENRAPA